MISLAVVSAGRWRNQCAADVCHLPLHAYESVDDHHRPSHRAHTTRRGAHWPSENCITAPQNSAPSSSSGLTMPISLVALALAFFFLPFLPFGAFASTKHLSRSWTLSFFLCVAAEVVGAHVTRAGFDAWHRMV